MAGSNTITTEFVYELAVCLHHTLVRCFCSNPCARVSRLPCPSVRAQTSFSFSEIQRGPGASCLLFLQVEVKQQEEPAGERTGGSHSAGGLSALAAEKVSGGWWLSP